MSDDKTPCTGRFREFFSGINSTEVAKRMCAGCPILDGCLRDALRMEYSSPASMRDGVWGGTTPKQRHLIATKGMGHPDAHRLQHFARGEDPADCLRCTAAEAEQLESAA